MYHLRLLKALSYTGIVSATKTHPDVFVEDKATADAAVATGYFKLLESGEEIPAANEESEPGKTLEEMTVSELETYAAYHNVSLKGISKKADIIAKLKEELGDEETENEVDYGSPTMVDLQEH
nr:MAG: Thymopoietin protein [Bacteriophage sp.]